MNTFTSIPQQPIIAKYSKDHHNGIQSLTLSRHGIGFVLKGRKFIHYGDLRHEVEKGDLFYLSSGSHYVEDIPDNGKSFEQIVFYFTPDQLSAILSNLSLNYGLTFSNDHTCENCHGKSYVIYPGWGAIRNFFSTVNQYHKEGLFSNDATAESLKMTELVYLLFSRPDCCIKSKILEHTDRLKESFELTMHKNIFNDISIDELARQCNRSLTSFKKEFRKRFHEPPHKWFIKQRLMHARLLLISTGKSISEIGAECNFPNTSHFIKLFKKEYLMTPAAYRNRHNERGADGETTKIKEEKVNA